MTLEHCEQPLTLYAAANQNGGYSILARVTSLDGSGEEVNEAEGNCLKQADVALIQSQIRDLGTDINNPAGTHVTPDPVLTPVGNMFDVLQTTGWPTDRDQAGYNFRQDVSQTYTAVGNHWYLVETKLTLVSGAVAWVRAKVKAVAIQFS